MAIKRALVVDDSRSARISLKRMLEEHGLQVELAGSGEEAIEFLKKERNHKHDRIDVIFMDHTMPGMDGLEAVSVIKSDPKTATIPVMMYTTKEGEVYVGQARALGAVGVMPKNVQKHQIFDMLLKLGLVKERRGTTPAADTHRAISDDLAAAVDEVDRELDRQVEGIAMQSVVRRILEDQHLTLRSDILRTQKAFAKEVAREVLKEHLALEESEVALTEEPVAERRPSAQRPWLAAAAAIVIAVSSFLAWQFKVERDEALASLRMVEAQGSLQASDQLDYLGREVERLQVQADNLREDALDAVVWSMNEGNFVSLREPAFGARLAEKVLSFVPYLEEIGFAGEIRLISHLGQFCLQNDPAGEWVPAAADTPIGQCQHVGHPLDQSDYVSDRLSVAFSELLLEEPAPGIRLELSALNAQQSSPYVEYPQGAVSAAQWNATALLNNRVEVQLVPDLALARN